MLRSRRLGCRVVPRLTTAHNFQFRALKLYRFLCSLQQQDVCTALWWDWGPLDRCSFLPRVIVGRLVLARAKWLICGEEFKKLQTLRGAARFEYVRSLRRARGLPRFVVVPDGDNGLTVDLQNVLSVEAMADLLKTRSELILTEMFPEPDELCATGPEGRFVHEILLPVVRKSDRRQAEVPRIQGRSHDICVPRKLTPGSEWLYLKLYCGIAGADRILCEHLAPLVRELLRAGIADSWFFIRYGDPHWHLRLRLHGNKSRLSAEALPAVHGTLGPLLADGTIWRVQVDTYERELERYGGTRGIQLAEACFWHDSSAVVDVLSSFGGDEAADARWRLALCGIDFLLDDFGLPLIDKLEFVDNCRRARRREFWDGGQVRVQLGDKFRSVHAGLLDLLDPQARSRTTLSPAIERLTQRSSGMRPIAEEIRRLSGMQSMKLSALIASFAHMHANRMLRSAGGPQELVLYDFLGRLYRTSLARSGGRVRRRSV